jgi:hypothetical protein
MSLEQTIAAAFETELMHDAGLPPQQRAAALAHIAVEQILAFISVTTTP